MRAMWILGLCLGLEAGALAQAKPGPDQVEMKVAAVVPSKGGGAAVLLVEAASRGTPSPAAQGGSPARRKVVPIFVGAAEALSIDLRLNKRRPERPLTHDLLDSIVRELGAKVVRVQVDELRDGVFIGTVFVQRPGERVARVDARSSDAIALALGNGLPIWVARKVIDAAGVNPESLERDEPESEPEPPHVAPRPRPGDPI